MVSNGLCYMSNICKTYGDVNVLDKVSIALKEGEIYSIIGDNGAGKSVLMRILGGFEAPNSGEIFIHGKCYKTYTTSQATKLGISFISDTSMLVPEMTVLDNILLGKFPQKSGIKALDIQSACKIGEKIFALLDFQVDLNRKVNTFGTAERRMIALAKAFCCNVKILILDEAELGLNDQECEAFYREIVNLKKYGISTFFISQKTKVVLEISDRISFMDEGRIAWTMKNTSENKDKIYEKLYLNSFKNSYPKLHFHIGPVVLKVDHLSNATTLKDISFELHSGEILGITGEAGSGRTSFARCVFGMDHSCKGDISIQQIKVQIRSPRDAIGFKIGYVEEILENDLVPEMSAVENITLTKLKSFLNGRILNRKLERSVASTYFEKIGLPDEKQICAVKKLSCGDKQKVILAKLVFSNSKIIILDEPTTRLDVATKVEFYNIMEELAAQGISFLFISTDMNELKGMCDRILTLKDGRLSNEN